MCSAQEDAAKHVRSTLLKLVGKESVALTGGDNIVKDADGLAFDALGVKLNDAHLADVLVVAVLMNGQTLT